MNKSSVEGQFLALLNDMRGGALLAELDAAMAELGQAIESTHLPGDISLKLRFVPADKSSGGLLLVYDSVSVKAPRLAKRSTVVFNEEGRMSREDPKQHTIDEVLAPVAVERPAIQAVPHPAAKGA